jgi:poly-beta-1,6-N-acetyl-D-glucosamine synthase
LVGEKKDMTAYVIVLPVRNEERFIQKAVDTIVKQTILPAKCIIVDDGSSDNTSEIVKSAACRYDWIDIIAIPDRGYDAVGSGVSAALNCGIMEVWKMNWDLLLKLDADIELPSSYCELFLKKFEKLPQLGIASGTTYYKKGAEKRIEKAPSDVPMGAARFYRRKCLNSISGIITATGWDTVDLIRAQRAGWKTQRFEEIEILHNRRMSSRNGLLKGKTREGMTRYALGYHPLFVLARCIVHLGMPTRIIDSLGIFYGYAKAFFSKHPRILNENERQYVRSRQLLRLFGISSFRSVYEKRNAFPVAKNQGSSVPFDKYSRKTALQCIEENISAGKKMRVFFLNLHNLNIAYHNRDYRAVLYDSELILPDGIGISILSKRHDQSLLEDCNGTDLLPCIFGLLERYGKKVFLLGGQEGIAEKASREVLLHYPMLKIVGYHHGFCHDEKDIVENIARLNPDALIVGMGTPLQELWISENYSKFNNMLFVGVGGYFDILAGKIYRPCSILRKCHLEWFGRISQEPQRLFPRYILSDFPFFLREFCFKKVLPYPPIFVRNKMRSSTSIFEFEEKREDVGEMQMEETETR